MSLMPLVWSGWVVSVEEDPALREEAVAQVEAEQAAEPVLFSVVQAWAGRQPLRFSIVRHFVGDVWDGNGGRGRWHRSVPGDRLARLREFQRAGGTDPPSDPGGQRHRAACRR